MVKRIKKRVPKSKNEEIVQEGTEIEVEAELVHQEDESESEAPLDVSEAFKLEIAQNAQGVSADRFSEVMEGVLLGLAENWTSVLSVFVVALGVYGFVQYSDSSAKEALAEQRGQLQKAFTDYKSVQFEATQVLKQKAQSAQENILGLSVDAASEVEAPKAEAYQAAAKAFKNLKLSGKTAPLQMMAEASALFDAAKTTAEFEAVAVLYTKVAEDSGIEPIAQSLAAQNAAIAYEEAAKLATDKKALWAKAAKAWEKMGQADKEIFDLKAQVNRARVLRVSGDLSGARKVYEGLKMLYATELQDVSNRELNQQVKLGMALTSSAKTAQ